MAMQINGNFDYSGTDYAERVKEKQAAERAEKAKEAEKAAEEKNPGKPSEPKDEYISSERSGREPVGLYRLGRNENGDRKIFFNDPNPKAAEDDSEKSADGKERKAGGSGQGKPVEKCVTNTDKVDREIKNLKERRQQLMQQIQSASGDEKKIREWERKLTQVDNELSQKDNDTYRRQNASVTQC